jgi:hypothetical protein
MVGQVKVSSGGKAIVKVPTGAFKAAKTHMLRVQYQGNSQAKPSGKITAQLRVVE